MHPSHSDEPSRVVVYEYGQGEQESALVIDEVFPTSHARHDWPCSELYQPCAHEVQLPPSASVPGSHCKQTLCSAFVTSPSPHALHDDAPPLDTVPAVHAVHDDAPSVEAVPASHVTHSTLPVVAACLPVAQLKHWAEPEACA